MRFIIFQNERIQRKEIVAITAYNYIRSLKLFIDMNFDMPPINWKKITRGLPSRREIANDRAPTIEEIQKIEEVEFPFGKIPIGINELVAIFPLTLAIGFAIYSYLIGDTIRSRKVIHNYYDETNKKLDELKLNRKVSSIAPLWIDPVNYNKYISLNFLIIFIPFVIFIFSLYLIFDSWTKTDQINMETIFPYNIELYKQFYKCIYIFSFGFFIYGIARIVYEFLTYNIKS